MISKKLKRDKREYPKPKCEQPDARAVSALLPRQDNCLHGMVDQYTFQVSTDGENWTMASEGEFGNLRANPVEHSVSFPPVKTRYFKFIAKHAIEMKHATVAEIGVVEAK